MSRPSLKQQRSQQIIEAYETCVARYGVEGATLERIASKAGLARPLIRHNVGNRDDLMGALLKRFETKCKEDTQRLKMALPDIDRVQTLIEWLFDPSYSDTKTVLVANALVVAAPDNPDVTKQLKSWLGSFTDFLVVELKAENPDASDEQLYAVATGLCGIYSNMEAFSPLGDIEKLRTASKQSAQILVKTLSQ